MKNQTTPLNRLFIILVSLTLSACASTISSEIDTADHANLNGFQTYAWIGPELTLSNTQAPQVINPINTQRIRTAIDEELKLKGYKRVSLEQADFAIAAAVGANHRVQLRQNYNGLGYNSFRRFGRFGGFGGLGGFNQSASLQNTTEGVLVVDVFENSAKEAVWSGSASKRLSKKYNTPELINEAVMTLLDQFPDRRADRADNKVHTDVMT